MKNRYKTHTLIYGFIYLSLIPIFGVLYYSLPENYIIYSHGGGKFLNSFYFSIVTVTTLGYGDILPVGELAKILVGLQSFLGILFVGLFLHSLSLKHTRNLEILDEKNKMSARIVAYYDIAFFLYRIIDLWRTIYVDLVEKEIILDKKNFKKIEDLFNIEFFSLLLNNLRLESQARVYPRGQLWLDYIQDNSEETLKLGNKILNRYPSIINYKLYRAVHELVDGKPGFHYLKHMVEIKNDYLFFKRENKKWFYLRSYLNFSKSEDLKPFVDLYYLCVQEEEYIKQHNPNIELFNVKEYMPQIVRFNNLE